jgi:N-acetylmuramoyl-L-alanine amidase
MQRKTVGTGEMRTDLVRRTRALLLLVIICAAATGGAVSWRSARAGSGPAWLRRLAGPPQVLAGRHIGIVAGHSGNDAGTVCPDGLTEASVNAKVAEMVAHELTRFGATVDMLKEFDDRLPGYQADAFLSIHTDSCKPDLNLSGFKVATLEHASAASETFVDCLWQQYEISTGLKRELNTITDDMTDYHSFHEIAPDTPAAIIEIGFLHADRTLLTERPQLVAGGIVQAFQCFLVPNGLP